MKVVWSDVGTDWRKFRSNDGLSYQDAQVAVEGLLEGEFLHRTAQSINPNYRGDIQTVQTKMIQSGRKYGVFYVDAGGYQFVLALAKGGDKLNQELEDDYRELKKLRQKLEEQKLPIFVPRQFVLGNHNGTSGFSMEYLSQHVELLVRPSAKLQRLGIPYAEFYMNQGLAKAYKFNRQQMQAADNMMAELPSSTPITVDMLERHTYYGINKRIATGLVTRLYLLNRITGGVPNELSTNAGDFMANPDTEDFDLQLTTMRGGLRPLNPDGFQKWLSQHRERTLTSNQILEFLLFEDRDGLVGEGIRKGRELFDGTGSNLAH